MKTLINSHLNTTEEKMYDEQLQRCIKELNELVESLQGHTNPGSRPGSLKRKAAHYLGKDACDDLSKTELKQLRAKAKKMKTSDRKDERQRGTKLARQVSVAFNMKDSK